MASVDYYHGQVLEEIVQGEEAWQWALRLSGGAVIKNWDERRTSAPEIPQGSGFLLTTFDVSQTTLVFGVVDPITETPTEQGRVVFTPTQYSITDPVYAAEDEFPQRNLDAVVENESELYPEHLQLREQEGPEEGSENAPAADD